MAGTFTKLLYHIVFSTKHREGRITAEVGPELYKYIGGIIRNEGGAMIEIGGAADHVHILAKFRADAAVSDMVRSIKANSSRWMNDGAGGAERFEWQAGYGAFTVSDSQVGAVLAYIRGQAEHHRRRSFQEEFVAFLDRHGIQFDQRYVWE